MKNTHILYIVYFISINYFAQITNTQVINNANSYLNHNWTASSNNIKNNDLCGGKTINTPNWVTVGNHTSLPYCWGGNNSLTDYDNLLLQGRSAGDNNTSVGYGAEPNCTAGVDCSGFVSRCYGLSTHYSTSMLNTNSLFGHHNNMSDLNNGDFINKPGSHTRLVTQINNNGTITTIESGSGVGNVGGQGLWKVFQWTYNVSSLINNGYNPQYYINMTNSVNNDNCSNAIVLNASQNCNYTSGTVDNATYNGLPRPSCDNLSNAPKGVWYKFTASSSSNTIKVSPNSVMNAVIAVYSGNNCSNLNEIGCNGALSGDSGNDVEVNYNSFNIGQTYWVRVYDYGNNDPLNGNFNICIISNPPENITTLNPSVAPTTINAGNTINLASTQSYTGSQLSSNLPNFKLGYYLSTDCNLSSNDVLLGIDSVNIGSDTPTQYISKTVTIPNTTTAGNYYILFSSDNNNELAETNENDNVECVQITINSYVNTDNISLSNITVTPTVINAGNSMNLASTHNYTGSQHSANLPNFKLGYYLSTDCNLSSNDVLLGIDSVNIGSDTPTQYISKTVTIPNTTTAGNYYILFSSDNNNELAETNENDNVECVQITVQNPVSINYYENNKLLIYPNPTSEIINIKHSKDQVISRLTMYDINGRKIKEINKDNINRVDVSEFPKGLYLLHITIKGNNNSIVKTIDVK